MMAPPWVDDVRRQAGRSSSEFVDVARESLLVAAPDVEAVDAGLEPLVNWSDAVGVVAFCEASR